MAESLVIKILGETKNFQAAIKSTQAATADLQRDLSEIAKKATVAFAGLTATIGGLIATYRVQEQAEQKLEAALTSTSHAAGLNASELKNMAAELQKVTTFGDEAIIEAQSLLLTFTKIGKDVFPMATESILNMSTMLKTDLKSSTIMLGKALNDPIAGITALTRSGVQFTEAQKEMIKAQVESGDTSRAQSIILKELETQFGGQARAAAEGTGRFIQLGGALSDVGEAVGKHLVPPLSKMAHWFNVIILDTLKANGEEFGKTAARILLIATNATILTGGLALATKALIAVRAAVKGLSVSIRGLRAAIVSTGIGALIIAVSIAVEQFVQDFEVNMKRAGMLWHALGELLKSSWKNTIDYLNKEFEGYMVQWKILGEIVQETFTGVVDFAKEAFTTVTEWISGKKEEVKEKDIVDKEEALTSEQEFVDKQKEIWGNFYSVFGEMKRVSDQTIKEEKDKNRVKEEQEDLKAKTKKKKDVLDEERMIIASDNRMITNYLKNKKLEDKREKERNKERAINFKSTLGTIGTLTSSSNQELFTIGKAAALATAYIDGKAAILKALSSAPWPFNLALAAGAAAAVGVQIASIASASPPKMADGGMITGGLTGTDSVPAMLMPGELVVPTRNFEEVVGAVGGGRDAEIFGGESQMGIVIGFDSDEAGQVLTAQQIEDQALGISIEEAS